MLRQRFALVIVVLLLASLGVLLAYGATWVVAAVPVFAGSDEGVSREVPLTGRDLVPLGAAMGWVGLAAIAALLATRTWGRRVTGAVVLVAGGIAGVTGVAFGFAEAATGGTGAFGEAALGSRTDALPTSVSVSAWWLLAIVSGLAMMVCGLLALIEGPSWPRLGARYSRSSTQAPASAAATWDALDRGVDPTVLDEPIPAEEADPGSMGSTGHHSEEDR